MRVRNLLFGYLVALFAATDALAQNSINKPNPAADSTSGASAGAEENTLAPVIVQPEAGASQSDVPNYDVSGEGGNGFGEGGFGGFGNGMGTGGPISWNSGAITTDRQRVGTYNQPAWTTQRPFTTTRTYVIPAGTYEFEQWVRPTWNKDDPTEYRMLEEISLGLGCRVQLDLYERWNIEPDVNGKEQANHEGVQIEMRYALADWGVIPFNPTLYAEWIERGGPQDDKPNKFETKLLFADELSPNLYYASNVILEQEVSDTLETEIGWNNAFGTTVIERKLLAGVESEFSSTTQKGSRGEPETLLSFGPSLQYRPTPRQFIDVVGLFGVTDDSYLARMYIVWGFQFGTRAGPSSGYAGGPASSYFNGGGGEYRGSAATRGD